jgi:hypothetical protein
MNKGDLDLEAEEGVSDSEAEMGDLDAEERKCKLSERVIIEIGGPI